MRFKTKNEDLKHDKIGNFKIQIEEEDPSRKTTLTLKSKFYQAFMASSRFQLLTPYFLRNIDHSYRYSLLNEEFRKNLSIRNEG